MSENETGTADERIRVMICDDHALFRRGLIMAVSYTHLTLPTIYSV